MIVSCPSCGKSYKRPPAPTRARARCGCCATTIDLSGLRPYRIVRDETPEPALAMPIAASAAVWDESDPLPEIPEMAAAASEFERPAEAADEAERAIAESARRGGSPFAVYGFWAAGGAIVGTGTSWTLGGTTALGLALGGLSGLAAAWGWLRWTSRP